MGYYPVTQGEIRLDGRPLASLSHTVLRKGVAMVQQDPVVLADTFYANVTLGRDYSEAQVWAVLETVQLAELARGFSDGINTKLGEQGNNLSVGARPHDAGGDCSPALHHRRRGHDSGAASRTGRGARYAPRAAGSTRALLADVPAAAGGRRAGRQRA